MVPLVSSSPEGCHLEEGCHLQTYRGSLKAMQGWHLGVRRT